MKTLILILSLTTFFGVNQPAAKTSSDTLIRVYKEVEYELGTPCGYINQNGDTVIPIGKYLYCYFDTAIHYMILGDTSGWFAANLQENKLFEIYWFDMGPDPLSDGLFRIRNGELIGYADSMANVVIPPQFSCAFPFENGRAKVTYNCELIPHGEHSAMKSDDWFWIDREGDKIPDKP